MMRQLIVFIRYYLAGRPPAARAGLCAREILPRPAEFAGFK
jgi:hypothetical protein